MQLNTLDIIFAVPLLYGLYKGFTRGLIIEIASLVGLVLGIYGGVHFSHKTAEVLGEHVNLAGSAMQLTSFIVTFLLILCAVYFLAKVVEKAVSFVAMAFLNKIGGAFFGVFKMAVIMSVFLIVVEALDRRWEFIPKKTKQDSMLYAPTASIAPLIVPVFKESDWYDKLEVEDELIPPPDLDQLKPAI